MKTKTVLLRGVEIGAGRPKIIVPIVGKTEQEILDKAAQLVQAKPDVVEWRVDYFQGVGDVQRVVDTARRLNEALGEIPILFTFRTKREGGEKEIGMEDYTALNRAVAQSSYVDAVDVEIFSGDEVVRKNISAIHDAGAAVVGSSHEFHRTPEHAELIYRLYKFGSEEEAKGYCLYPLGCRGPQTKANCGVTMWNNRRSWCVQSGAADHVHGVGRRHQPPVRRGVRLRRHLRHGGPGLRPRPDPGGSAGTGAGDPPQSAVSPDILSEQGGE